MFMEHGPNIPDSQEQWCFPWNIMRRSQLLVATEPSNRPSVQTIKKSFQMLRFIINRYYAKQSVNVFMYYTKKTKSQTNKNKNMRLTVLDQYLLQ